MLAGEWVKVLLKDVNRSEVGRLRLKSNAYGSFSGEFKLPANGLTGEYTLTADEDLEEDSRFYDEEMDDFFSGDLTITVEEYKRPTFEVSFQPVTKTFILRDTVTLKGTALSFSGAKVSGARFHYHIQRNVRYPGWYYWYHSYAREGAREIAFGEGATDAAGEFAINFSAEPDETVSRKEHPVFHYEVTVDITDMNGETRSATFIVKVGYTALVATVSAPARMNRKELSHTIVIGTENQNGQFVPTKGHVAIYKLKFPAAPARSLPWEATDIPLATEDAFHKLFPHDSYNDDGKSKALQKEKRMAEFSFNTGVAKEIPFKVNAAWPNGSYVMELTTVDVSGDTLTDLHRFTVFDPSAKTVDDNQLLVFEMDKPSYLVGEVAKVRIGSAATDITITIDIEKNNKIMKTYVDHFSGNLREYNIPVTEDMGTGFAVHYNASCYNALLSGSRTAQIESPRKKLEIETVTFKDKLQPGGKETWSFSVKGDDFLRKHTEILASMYDASLDQFVPHAWSFNPVHTEAYYSSYRTSGNRSFNTSKFTIRNGSYGFYSIPRQYYDDLYWFGFSIRNNQYYNGLYLGRLYSSGSSVNRPSKVILSNNRNGAKGVIYGKVATHDGEPLPGVNIVVKGTTNGTVTNTRGEYSVEANRGDSLIFSFVGFSTAKAAVGRKNVINVMLEEEIMRLSEVVITAYGTQEKKMLTGSVVSITTESAVVFATPEGRAKGIRIISADGHLGYMSLRGNSSVNYADALYVVDGVIVESSKIDQADLAEVQVLKGDAAISLYGSRAVNGVIVVTTKSGQKKLDEVMAKINARKNFNETAFFFPHLTTDENGMIHFTFTTPEALTRWKLQLLGHTRDLVTVSQTLQAVTQKELMVTPNMPRFLREGDDVILSVKIANLTSKSKEGKVALQLTNPVTGAAVDVFYGNQVRTKSFKAGPKGNTEVSWKLHVPDQGAEALQYKVVAKAGAFSDGEQNALPVLSNRMLVTESLPMYVRAGQTKTFTLEKLKTSNSPTLVHHQVTLEVTSNPAWLAVKSLPYLMEFPHECAEQLFSRYYANTLASYIANSQPKIKEVFAAWSASGALTSNLEKNPELKSIIIEETPWLRDAQSESEQAQRLGLLFDLNTLKDQSDAAVPKLGEMQRGDGGFPWFTGADHSSRYITQHVAAGYGHLKQLNVVSANDKAAAIVHRAVDFLDEQIISDYTYLQSEASAKFKNSKDSEKLIRAYLDQQPCYPEQIQYLYMRSFFSDVAVSERLAPVLEYYRRQTARRWTEADLYLKGMIALIQQRQGDAAVARAIVASLRETSITSDEMGMYWKENTPNWSWYRAPVETQALMIEAFNEIEGSDKTIAPDQKTKTLDELRIWLLKNKQTTQWKTTKATTEAIYALLLNGSDWLPLNHTLDVTVGTKEIKPDTHSPEAGTGYFKTSWKGGDATPALSTVTLAKKENGIAWGGLYWQYFEDLDKITPAETPLKLSKKIFLVNRTDKGELLTEVKPGSASLAVGDLLRVRIELKADRQMEFLHMKDMRAAGLEPVDVLSEYKWQVGLGYYQSTKDAATHFFFDTMEKGVYVFEYDLRVNNAGNFSNGVTTIESMYAPEFTSHSEGSGSKWRNEDGADDRAGLFFRDRRWILAVVHVHPV